MLKAGVETDTVSYNAVIKACAEAGEAAKAEHWMLMMLKVGVAADIISFNAVIRAYAEARS